MRTSVTLPASWKTSRNFDSVISNKRLLKRKINILQSFRRNHDYLLNKNSLSDWPRSEHFQRHIVDIKTRYFGNWHTVKSSRVTTRWRSSFFTPNLSILVKKLMMNEIKKPWRSATISRDAFLIFEFVQFPFFAVFKTMQLAAI